MPRSNIFEAGAASSADLFASYIESAFESPNSIVLVLSKHELGANARNAIEKSFAALGYSGNIQTYATLLPHDCAPGETGVMLDPQAVFLLVEGLDPLFVITADSASTQTLGAAYRTEYAPDSAIRAFGRPAIAFANLDALLETDAGKQKAWRLFKSIPKRG